jgi:PAS domain S-box-containing protein
LIGKFPLDYADPKEADSINELITNFIADRVADYSSTAVFKPLNIQFRHKNGVYIWVEVLVGFITENGVLIGVQTSCRDITSEIEAELASKKALLRQRELNELRTNLVSTISHEFRTPMTTIRTSAELINMYLEGQNIKNGPQLQKRVDIITQEIDRIVELMNAVLTISKEDSGKTTYLPTLFNLKTLCIETIDKNFTEVKGQGKVKIEFTGNNFLVYADKNLMEYSISNLLSNGFKYSDKSADIELNIQSIDTNCVVKITDYGIGIPEKDIDKVFNTFYRASNTDGIPGTGLGLHIVKTFVKKNKGTVSLESELGKGTKVTASFPLIKQKNGE